MKAQSRTLFAGRATTLIVAGCSLSPRHVVLLPALFCTEVAEAIEAVGLRYRCYDMPSDLSCASTQIHQAMGDDVGSIVLLHPFGLSRPLEGLDVARDTIVIEDACHALRTSILDQRIGGTGALTIYSLRKEFDWKDGGLARGPLTAGLRRLVPESDHIAQLWRAADPDGLAHAGRLATQAALERLGDRLPHLTEGEVLTAIPLKSRQRDACIQRLRRRGVPAWRWRRSLKTVGPASTPQAWTLRRELFLVPLPMGDAAERVLEYVAAEPIRDWIE